MKVPSQDILVGKRLDLDTHPSLSGQGSLAYMLNGAVSGYESNSLDGFVQNVLSNELCFKFPKDYTLVGFCRLDKEQFLLFFHVNGVPDTSEIGLFDASTCAYIPKVKNSCLGFTVDSKIRTEFKFLSGCNKRRVYFVDPGSNIRFIDVDDCLPTKNIVECGSCEKDEVFDCDGFNLNKSVKFPQISLREGVGNLPNGNYQIAIAFSDDEQRFTEYHVYPEVLKFHSNNQGNNRFGIEIEFDNCPFGTDQYELVLISNRTDRATQAQRIGFFGIDQTSIFISELDDPSYTPLDMTVLSEVFPYYQSAKDIAQNNEQLILTGVTYRETPNYQPRARKIRSRWVEKRVRAEEAHRHKSFMRGEVYGFTINGVYKDGEKTVEYHIPSDAEEKIKSKPGGDDIFDSLFDRVINNDTCEDDDPCNPQEVVNWQIYDSSAVVEAGEVDENENNICWFYQVVELPGVSDICQGVVPGVPFTRIDKQIEIFLRNGYCEPAVVDVDIVMKATFTITDCTGATSSQDQFFTLPAGNSSFTYTWVESQKVDCGQGECLDETKVLDSLVIEDAGGVDLCPEGPPDCAERIYCDGEITKKGDFGYWESTLQYPNNPCVWGQRSNPEGEFYDPLGLSCEKIRYHKFPDNATTHIHGKNPCGGQEYVYILGIEFENIQPFVDKFGIPLKDIVGYEINVYDRAGHKSIIHKGLMYNMFEEKLSDCSTSYYSNYPFNDLNPDVFLSKTPAYHPVLPFLDAAPFLEWGYDPVDTYSRSRFEYISPDVSFERNDAGQFVQLYTEENGPVSGQFTYSEELPKQVVISDFAYAAIIGIMAGAALLLDVDGAINAGQNMLNALQNSLKAVQYGITYAAKTSYSSYNTNKIVPGNQRRKINVSQYTLPTKMLVGNNKVNNYQRQSGLFLELCGDINDPHVKERSRIRYGDNFCKPSFSYCEETNFNEIPVTSSYYAGVKVERPNQYGVPGSVKSRKILDSSVTIGWNNQTTVSSPAIFGGDIFITKHKYIRKMPFFTALPINLPNETPLNTRQYMNVWHTRYWMNPSNAASIALLFPFNVIGAAYMLNDERNLEETGSLLKRNCDNDAVSCSKENVFRVDGTFYTHVIGEVEYWCESEFIGNFRELNEIPESDVDRPLEEKLKYRTIQYPELFLYNRQYHWQGFSKYIGAADPEYDCCKGGVICSDNTMAYSLKNDPLRKGDAWLKFLPNNTQQFSSKDGRLIGVRAIDDYNLLIFFEDATYVTQQDEQLVAKGSSVFLGTPDAFSRRLRKISDDSTGFGGCVDLDSVVPTKYGVFWFDRKRKKVVRFGEQLYDVTGKIQSWLNENVPDIASTIPDRIVGVFDNYTDTIFFTGTGSKPTCKWTVSLKPGLTFGDDRNGWISFHSFAGKHYLPMSNNFLSSNGSGLWKHNKIGSYQTYYGATYPFVVGTTMQAKGVDLRTQHLEVYAEFSKINKFGKAEYDNSVFFDKILTYNQLRTTGLKDILLKVRNNENHLTVQNRTDLVEATQVEDFIYRINKFAVESTYQPAICLECMDVTSTSVINEPENINQVYPGVMSGRWYKVHLQNDKPDYKVLLQMNIGNNEQVQQ